MMRQRKDRTEEDIYRLGFRQAFLRSKGGPFLKNLNWYTGFGKTHNAAVFAIEVFCNAGDIPVFIAPLQSLVAGFEKQIHRQTQAKDYADKIEALVQQRGRRVPVHRLFSRDYHMEDRSFLEAAVRLCDWLRSQPTLLARLEREGANKNTAAMADAVEHLRKQSRLCLQSKVHDMNRSDELYEFELEAYRKRAGEALSAANRVTRRLIEVDVLARSEGRTGPTLLNEPPLADMVRRLYPLQAFLDTPGIIVSTASKARVQQDVFMRDGSGKAKWHPFEALPHFLRSMNTPDSALAKRLGKPLGARVITFLDEEEDAYWFLFKERKSVLNSEGRNDLNIVITQFFTLLDLKWPLALERVSAKFAQKVFWHLESIAAVSFEASRRCKEMKLLMKAERLPESERVRILRETLVAEQHTRAALAFDDDEFKEIWRRLIDQNDEHNKFRRFNDKARVLARLREDFLRPMAGQIGEDAYELYCRLLGLVVDKKYFTMSRASYGEVLDQPGQTFFNQSANVMSTAFLRQVELLPETAGQTIRLEYHEAEPARTAFTLYHYLELVLLIAKVLNADGTDEVVIPAEERDLYAALWRFRGEVRSLFKKGPTEEGLARETHNDDVLTEEFFFKGTKSVVTLEESRREVDEYNLTADVNLTVTITSLKATPEQDIADALGRTNGVYLMSATGGLAGVSSGAFNQAELARVLEAKGGHVEGMSEEELEVVTKRAETSLAERSREVVILDDERPADGFGVSSGYKGLLAALMQAYERTDDKRFSYLNQYKRQEIAGLVASLDTAMSGGIRSGLVLCQTIRRVRAALLVLSRDPAKLVEALDKDGHVFQVNPRAFPDPAYRKGPGEPVVIVLYAADRFRRKDQKRMGVLNEDDDDGQFNRELNELLDITGRRLLIWTAFQSAARGMNFVTKFKGEERDFELFCLLNDPFYNRHTRPKSRGFSMETFQSFLQVVRDRSDDWALMTKEETLYEYSRHRSKYLRDEHYVDITRTIFQALGRSERTQSKTTPRQLILLSGDAAQTVSLGVRVAPELSARASPTQRAVLAAICSFNAKHVLFADAAARERHAQASLLAAVRFRKYTGDVPKRFRSNETARQEWSALFERDMFLNPARYLERLREKGVAEDFVQAAFLEAHPGVPLFVRRHSYAGLAEQIITDAIDGEGEYDVVGRLVPMGLADQLSPSSSQLLKGITKRCEVDTPKGPRELIPQPWFLTEIMKGYLGEEEFVGFVERHFGVRPGELHPVSNELQYVDVDEHEKGAELYQLFDFYLETNECFFAVDMKNWARLTDNLKGKELQVCAKEKAERLRKILPGKRVKALYINLQGAAKFPIGDDIHFMSLYVRSTRQQGGSWIANANLARLLLG